MVGQQLHWDGVEDRGYERVDLWHFNGMDGVGANTGNAFFVGKQNRLATAGHHLLQV